MKRAKGAEIKIDKTVTKENMLPGLRFSQVSGGFFNLGLEKTARSTDPVLESMAPAKANQEKSRVESEAYETPKMTGMMVTYTRGWKNSPKNSAEAAQVKRGSAALMIWKKETPPAPIAMTDER
jgi:hypothetical protein